jgi:hypothetical protein
MNKCQLPYENRNPGIQWFELFELEDDSECVARTRERRREAEHWPGVPQRLFELPVVK